MSERDNISESNSNELAISNKHPDSNRDATGNQEMASVETAAQQQATENMETHAHHLHKTPGHGWKHYLFEFFMLFFAISAGFFVENLRENVVEHKRAAEYAQLLVDDLNYDVAELNRAGRVLGKIIVASDTLSQLLGNADAIKTSGGKLYYYEYWSGWRWKIISRDATLQQLKNSGSLRYLGRPSLIRKILDYEETLKIIYLLQDQYEPEKMKNLEIVQKVFDQTYFNILDGIKEAVRDSTSKSFGVRSEALDRFLHTNYPLFSYEKSSLFEIKNWSQNTSRTYKIQLSNLVTAKRKAALAIEVLKKEYGFE